MKKLILLLTVLFFGFTTEAQNTENLLTNYIRIKNALVSSDSKAATSAIATFNDVIKSEEKFAQKVDLQKAIDKLIKADGNIEKQRASFNDLSTSMWNLIKLTDKTKQSVFYQYCPMKKSYWLSTEKEIKNPYYGSAMLTCGRVVETK